MYKVSKIKSRLLLIGTCANGVRLARGAAVESVWVVGLAVATAFDIAKAIVNVVWVATGELSAAIGHNLRDGLGSHGSVATAGLVTGTVQGGVELTPAGVVEDVPLTFGIGQIIGLIGVILKLFFRSQSGRIMLHY